jgi:hypothetical protein
VEDLARLKSTWIRWANGTDEDFTLVLSESLRVQVRVQVVNRLNWFDENVLMMIHDVFQALWNDW